MKPTIFVLMSTYNGEKYIEEQIESILSQEECDVQLIVRDDGSSDGTLKVLDRYSRKGLLQYSAGNNLGPAKSFLSLVIESKEADYYAFADQDDIWDPRKLIEGIQKLPQSVEPALYCSNLTKIGRQNQVIQENVLPNKIATDFVAVATGTGYLFGCTMVFNYTMKKLIQTCGMPRYFIMHDIWLGMIAALFGNLVYDSDSYIQYRVHENNFTHLERPEGLFGKIKQAASDSKFSFSEQYIAFGEYLENNRIWSSNSVCESMLDYKRRTSSKMRLLFYILFCKKQNVKRKGYCCIQILSNKF